MKICGSAFTHQGGIRLNNEDCIVVGCSIEHRSMDVPIQFCIENAERGLFLVADGIGGQKAGWKASKFVATAFKENRGRLQTENDLEVFLKQLNRDVFETSKSDQELEGMGTTVAGILSQQDSLYWFNIGDSKIFRYRDNYLRQLSIDDIQATTHIMTAASVITQAIGGVTQLADIHPHIGEEPLAQGWRYLICTDGLTDVLSRAVIERAMKHGDDVAAAQLLDQVLHAGAPDNISAILITVDDSAVEARDLGMDEIA